MIVNKEKKKSKRKPYEGKTEKEKKERAVK